MITIEASGIGRAAAARLAAHGHLVLIGSRRLDESERFAARLRDRGDSAFAAHLDLADPRSINRFLGAAQYLIGTPDVLITDVERVGAQTLVTRVIPAMIARGSGDVVLVGPELAGVRCAGVQRNFDAWLAGLDAEFVGTAVRASAVRATHSGAVASTGDAGRLVAGMVGSRLRLVELLPSAVPAR
ncbi:SDR family NAD(P)-dependent oxidoreductase [Mycolicibacter longobardus]|uniref:Short-chain dehydrogenase n=1 Tax=Mycolicibacter longobardus TaxID=1108812 RepID=A0A1X1YEF9_9MYCO|nr:SDR family NAD(P)-dependent oxidoreductase [Mycolicibacter longobardus]MCV7382993.1 SDR family NAD(P)-dependent oxidoreductase [Mycolicibacter longobardus]ORW09391.1 hypothetical protein AWC16_16340 [Mycolicibacter longobardus]